MKLKGAVIGLPDTSSTLLMISVLIDPCANGVLYVNNRVSGAEPFSLRTIVARLAMLLKLAVLAADVASRSRSKITFNVVAFTTSTFKTVGATFKKDQDGHACPVGRIQDRSSECRNI